MTIHRIVLLILSFLFFTSGLAVADSNPNLKQLIDVGGRKFNFVCSGSGVHTLIFLQGAGSSMTTWRKLREPVSHLARACFYDRAGFGYSEASPGPIDVVSVTSDLHALIKASGTKLPVILIGHSLGGYYATVYAERYSSDVAGLVLVDTSFSGQFDYQPSERDKALSREDFQQFNANLSRCASLARIGGLARDRPQDCFHIAPGLTGSELDYLTQEYTRPLYYESSLAEYRSFFPRDDWTTKNDDESRRFKQSLGSIPVEVLTAGNPPDNSRRSAEGNLHFAQRWAQGHKRLAALSTRGEATVVPGATHDIQNDRPDVVLNAIRKILAEAHQ
jgi:pimeloyl-ACP methyl ester carboxylesterase